MELVARGEDLLVVLGQRVTHDGFTFVGAEYDPDWWIFGMRVRGRYRGAGIGEGLLEMAIEKAIEEGALRIHLIVFNHNKAAMTLYRKMGFQPASIPGLERQLEDEVRQGGRRRIIMSRPVCFAHVI